MNIYLRRRARPPARGFTLIEILVVIGMLAILSTVVLVAVNPLRQFAEARNSERENDVAAILNSISERVADNGGTFSTPNDPLGCTVALPTTATVIGNAHPMDLDLRPCLVSAYLSELPHDPSTGQNTCTTQTCSTPDEHYYLGYTVFQDPATSRVTVCAPAAAEQAIIGSNAFCLTR
jgi:prepilin-type N-terminal cleavage/methylation domain-containing protein